MTRHKLVNPDIHSLLVPLAQDLERGPSTLRHLGRSHVTKTPGSQSLLSSTRLSLLGQLVSTAKPQPLSQVPQDFPASLSLPRLPSGQPTSVSAGLPHLKTLLFEGPPRAARFRPKGRTRLGKGFIPSHSEKYFKTPLLKWVSFMVFLPQCK